MSTTYTALLDKLIQLANEEKPSPVALNQIAAALYEDGYIDGKEMERRLMRLKLGLDVPEDRT